MLVVDAAVFARELSCYQPAVSIVFAFSGSTMASSSGRSSRFAPPRTTIPPSMRRTSSCPSLSEDATDYEKRVPFEITFVNGDSITKVADHLTSIGWAVKEAADYLGVPANEVRLLRGETILTCLHVKLFDALDATNSLNAVVVPM